MKVDCSSVKSFFNDLNINFNNKISEINSKIKEISCAVFGKIKCQLEKEKETPMGSILIPKIKIFYDECKPTLEAFEAISEDVGKFVDREAKLAMKPFKKLADKVYNSASKLKDAAIDRLPFTL